jgi:type IV pilus assembly protein PilV
MSASNRNFRRSLRPQSGVGIIEILVAVLVLSVGLLGLAGLQLRTLRNNQSALERGVAVTETHAVADAMRADRVNAVENDAYDIGLEDDAPTGTTFAEKVLAAWRANLQPSLGEDATGSVDCNGAACTIVIQWNDERGTDGDAEQQITTQVQL